MPRSCYLIIGHFLEDFRSKSHIKIPIYIKNQSKIWTDNVAINGWIDSTTFKFWDPCMKIEIEFYVALYNSQIRCDWRLLGVYTHNTLRARLVSRIG